MTKFLQVCDQCVSIPCGISNCIPCPPPFLSPELFHDISREQNLTDNEIGNISQACGLKTLRSSTTRSVDISTTQSSLSTLTSSINGSTSLHTSSVISTSSELSSSSSTSSTTSTKSIIFTSTPSDDSTNRPCPSPVPTWVYIGIVVVLMLLVCVVVVLLKYRRRFKRTNDIGDYAATENTNGNYDVMSSVRSRIYDTIQISSGESPGTNSTSSPNAEDIVRKTDAMDIAATSIDAIMLHTENKTCIGKITNEECHKMDRDKTNYYANQAFETTHM